LEEVVARVDAEAEAEDGVGEVARRVEGAGEGEGERSRGEWPGERSIAAAVAPAALCLLG
jgi:hypothetical protein